MQHVTGKKIKGRGEKNPKRLNSIHPWRYLTWKYCYNFNKLSFKSRWTASSNGEPELCRIDQFRRLFYFSFLIVGSSMRKCQCQWQKILQQRITSRPLIDANILCLSVWQTKNYSMIQSNFCSSMVSWSPICNFVKISVFLIDNSRS